VLFLWKFRFWRFLALSELSGLFCKKGFYKLSGLFCKRTPCILRSVLQKNLRGMNDRPVWRRGQGIHQNQFRPSHLRRPRQTFFWLCLSTPWRPESWRALHYTSMRVTSERVVAHTRTGHISSAHALNRYIHARHCALDTCTTHTIVRQCDCRNLQIAVVRTRTDSTQD